MGETGIGAELLLRVARECKVSLECGTLLAEDQDFTVST
jgi:hypothetical protein